MIRVMSGIGFHGGSTVAHCNLVNLLNKNGLKATFSAPLNHKWFLEKCESIPLDSLMLNQEDICIVHYLPPELFRQLKQEIKVKKLILSCHETNLYPTANININYLNKLDKIHYVSEFQKMWHGSKHPSVVIHNVINDIQKIEKKEKSGIAGIIGSIDNHKQTHYSIIRAITDGYKKINVYGTINDQWYYNSFVQPVLDMHKEIEVNFCGFEDNKHKIYSIVDEVFHSSMRETFNYIKAECEKYGVKYSGLNSSDPKIEKYMTNDEIFQKWKEIIE